LVETEGHAIKTGTGGDAMFTTTFTMATGRVITIETDAHPDLKVNPDGSIFNIDSTGVEWKIQWWQVQDIMVQPPTD
jgi:hypothetical protein